MEAAARELWNQTFPTLAWESAPTAAREVQRETVAQVLAVADEAEPVVPASDLEDAIEALDWAKAPTSDEHLDGLDRRLRQPLTGYKLAGRIRALYSRERLEANQQRGRAERAEAAARKFARAITEHRTAIHNAGNVRVVKDDIPVADAKHRADRRLWASLSPEYSEESGT